jgi:hypothetical protein
MAPDDLSDGAWKTNRILFNTLHEKRMRTDPRLESVLYEDNQKAEHRMMKNVPLLLADIQPISSQKIEHGMKDDLLSKARLFLQNQIQKEDRNKIRSSFCIYYCFILLSIV